MKAEETTSFLVLWLVDERPSPNEEGAARFLIRGSMSKEDSWSVSERDEGRSERERERERERDDELRGGGKALTRRLDDLVGVCKGTTGAA